MTLVMFFLDDEGGALQPYKLALSIIESTISADWKVTGESLSDIEDVLLPRGGCNGALINFQKRLEIELSEPNISIERAEAYRDIIRALEEKSDFKRAEEHIKLCLSIQEALLVGLEHSSTALSYSYLAWLLCIYINIYYLSINTTFHC